MKKNDWYWVIGAVLITWCLDQGTKMIAIKTIFGVKFYGGIFGLVMHKNPGAMLGMFADLPPMLRVVSLSTGGAFLVFIYGAIQYTLPSRSMTLRVGMSLLLGGILGNVTDRIIDGSVTDFLVIGTRSISTAAFNVADAVQWVGYFMVVWILVRDGKHIWPVDNERKQVWVNKHFQMKYIFVLLAVGLGFSIISGVYSYTYLKVTIDDLVIGRPQHLEEKFLRPFLFTFLIINTAFMIVLIMIGRVLSHRTAGPLYAFEKFLEDITSGKDRSLKLRAGDEFMHLEELAERIRYQLRSHFKPHGSEQNPGGQEEPSGTELSPDPPSEEPPNESPKPSPSGDDDKKLTS